MIYRAFAVLEKMDLTSAKQKLITYYACSLGIRNDNHHSSPEAFGMVCMAELLGPDPVTALAQDILQ